jgi:hypothetical protein
MSALYEVVQLNIFHVNYCGVLNKFHDLLESKPRSRMISFGNLPDL